MSHCQKYLSFRRVGHYAVRCEQSCSFKKPKNETLHSEHRIAFFVFWPPVFATKSMRIHSFSIPTGLHQFRLQVLIPSSVHMRQYLADKRMRRENVVKPSGKWGIPVLSLPDVLTFWWLYIDMPKFI